MSSPRQRVATKTRSDRDFPGGSVGKSLPSNARGQEGVVSLTPRQRTKIPHAAWCSQKTKQTNKKPHKRTKSSNRGGGSNLPERKRGWMIQGIAPTQSERNWTRERVCHPRAYLENHYPSSWGLSGITHRQAFSELQLTTEIICSRITTLLSGILNLFTCFLLFFSLKG